MEYLTKNELKRLFAVAYEKNRIKHLALVTGLWHGARVSEVLALTEKDIQDGQINIVRGKGSLATCQPIHRDSDPLFDESPIEVLASNTQGRLFPFSRQRADLFFKMCAAKAGIHRAKAHNHTLKHTCAMMLMEATGSIGQVQGYLGHKSAGSTMCYLVETDKRKAESAIAGIKI